MSGQDFLIIVKGQLTVISDEPFYNCSAKKKRQRIRGKKNTSEKCQIPALKRISAWLVEQNRAGGKGVAF
jgi:hypothetical protein